MTASADTTRRNHVTMLTIWLLSIESRVCVGGGGAIQLKDIVCSKDYSSKRER